MAGPFGKYHPPARAIFDPIHYAKLCRQLGKDMGAVQELFNLSGALKLESYDLTTASGTQNITGFQGFLPSAGLVFAGVDGGAMASFGMFDDTNNHCIAQVGGGTWDVDQTRALYLETSSGNSQSGVIARIPTGLQITWTKAGTPTGTALIGVLGLIG